jgi:hypothetical protein
MALYFLLNVFLVYPSTQRQACEEQEASSVVRINLADWMLDIPEMRYKV